MKQYLDLVKHVLKEGNEKSDRTGTGTKSVFGYQMRFKLSEGFPMVTTKKLHLKSIIYELLWFLKGETNINYLKENGVKIWDEWADDNGDLGPVYGHQWRNWNSDGIDQIKEVIETLKNNPDSRRMIVTAWNPGVLPDTTKSFKENVKQGKAALPPCHAFFQFYVHDNKLSCQLYQRSADIFLGVPFNIASYALLTEMVAHVCGYKAGDFVHTFGDAHIYNNHIEQLNLQLSRETKTLPKLKINKKINQKIINHAKKKKIIVYSSDNPEDSDFSNAAIIDFKKMIQVAIFTGGRSPVMSKKIKSKVEIVLKKVISKEDIAQIKIQKTSRKIAKEVIHSQSERKECLRSIMTDNRIDQLIKDGQIKKAEKRATEIIKKWK